MALGVLNIGIAEVASVLVLCIEKVRFGLVMSLGTFAFIIPIIMPQKICYFFSFVKFLTDGLGRKEAWRPPHFL